jgi:hypothetical protein
MRKLICFFLILLLIGSCGPTYQISKDFDKYYYSRYQIDSICKVDKIPTNLDKWSKMSYAGDTTTLSQYMYRRSNDSLEVVWTLTDLDSLYRFKKRTLKTINK